MAVLVLPHLVIRLIGGGYYTIPSSSMLPTLPVGSAFLAMPRGAGDVPARGEIVVFRNPPQSGVEYVQRVVGLPGDRVAVRAGVVWLNGEALPREEMSDFETLYERGGQRHPEHCQTDTAGSLCSFPQWRERLPDGGSYAVLDIHESPPDNFAEVQVPQGHVFVLGDNRDNAVDSRFPNVGMIPLGTLHSRAWRFWMNFSDPTAHLGRIGREVR